MAWNHLTDTEAVLRLDQESQNKPQIIFKHSTRCSISDMAKGRLDRGIGELEILAELHFLDLIRYRTVSDFIAEHFNVKHESPQILVIHNGNCILEQSHYDVRPEEINQILTQGTWA